VTRSVLTLSCEPKKSTLVGKLGDSESSWGLGTAGGAAGGSSAAILSSSSTHDTSTATSVVDLEEWCVVAIYAMSCDSLRFRSLAHAADAEEALG
jgi:hypothetical protein